MGYFLRAYLNFGFDPMDERKDENLPPVAEQVERVLQIVNSKLIPARVHIYQSPWAGLPELTNKDGAECHGSCPTQAWSSSTMLDLEYDMWKMRELFLHRTLTLEFETCCDAD
jgi:glycogen debranching enzyme